MKNTRDLYWTAFAEFCFHALECKGRYDTRQMMLYISKEMILRGEY